MEETKKSGLATAAMVLGIIGIVLSFLPVINNVAFVLGILAVIFSIICLVKKVGKGKAIAGLVLGILAIIITLAMQSLFVKAVDDAFTETFADRTEEILAKEADVKLGSFEVIKGEFMDDTKLVVTLTNKTNKTRSFSVKVEAIDANGARLSTEDAYFDTVAAGQTVTNEIFTFVTDEKIDSYKTATFKIIEASSY